MKRRISSNASATPEALLSRARKVNAAYILSKTRALNRRGRKRIVTYGGGVHATFHILLVQGRRSQSLGLRIDHHNTKMAY